MFGNIKPSKSELTIGQYTNYRAYYCGLCKSMGKKYAGLCNLGLSYEAVFIAIIMNSLSEEDVYVKRQSCFVHPFTKTPMVVHNAGVDKAAAINVLLIYNKIKDDIKDENKLRSKILAVWFKKSYLKAAKDNKSIDDIVADKLDDLALLEEGLCSVLDMAAQPFAEMMGELARSVMPDAGDDIYWFGFFMGKWLYVIDAYADIDNDIKNNSYNPFLLMNNEADKALVKDEVREDARFVLEGALTEIGKLYDRLNIKKNKEILENILFMGMPRRTEEVLSGIEIVKPKDEYKMQ